jgi:hypothetical protein
VDNRLQTGLSCRELEIRVFFFQAWNADSASSHSFAPQALRPTATALYIRVDQLSSHQAQFTSVINDVQEYEVNEINHRHTIYVENPFNAKGKNYGHQPATISLSQEFWITRLWRLTRESSLHETLARVYIPATLRSGPSLRRRASALLRQKPGQYPEVNLEQLQQQLFATGHTNQWVHNFSEYAN